MATLEWKLLILNRIIALRRFAEPFQNLSNHFKNARAKAAEGYATSKDGLVNAGFIHMSIPFSAGALYSTTEDLLRWEQGLFGGKLLSAASLAKMTTPFKNAYACGMGVRKSGRHAARREAARSPRTSALSRRRP